MKPQAIFDTVATHLFTQGKPSMDEHGSCLYRGDNGSMCSVGKVLPDRYYRIDMEGTAVDGVVLRFKVPKWMEHNKNLLSNLQHIHDDQSYHTKSGSFNKHKIRSELKAVAARHDLSADVLKTL